MNQRGKCLRRLALKKIVIGQLFASLALTLASAALTEAATIRVPQDATTIQQGINVAASGDTVLVAPGTYFENINFVGKAITVQSEQGPQVTIIDGHNTFGPIVTFQSGETQVSRLSGFRLQNGRASFGAGIFIQSASPTVDGNIITHNEADAGAGVLMTASAAVIQNNQIIENRANSSTDGGGGMLIHNTTAARISGNSILNNSVAATGFGGGIYLLGTGNLTSLINNTISGNTAWAGGGIFIDGAITGADIVQNLIVNNSASAGGGGIAWSLSGSRLINNTIAENDSIGSGISVFFAPVLTNALIANNIIIAKQNQIALDCFNPINSPIFEFNNVYSSGGFSYGPGCGVQDPIKGSISLDPQFVNPTVGNYRLSLGSPSIDTGTNDIHGLPIADIDANPRIVDGDGAGGPIIDMGAFEFGDSMPPTINAISATPNTLIQANHQMVPVVINISASDDSDPVVLCRIISVSSNEPVEGLGDGDTAPDWTITADLALNVRAERSGKGVGRTYTITVECADSSGNKSTKPVTVSVPRNN